MKERGSNNRHQKEEGTVHHLQPAWCGSICRNSMKEICVEHCAIERHCSAFDPKPNLKLQDMPRFPKTESRTKEENFTSVTIYLSKVVDHLQGVEYVETYIQFPRPHPYHAGSSRLSENLKGEDLLPNLTPADAAHQDTTERKDQTIRPDSLVESSD